MRAQSIRVQVPERAERVQPVGRKGQERFEPFESVGTFLACLREHGITVADDIADITSVARTRWEAPPRDIDDVVAAHGRLDSRKVTHSAVHFGPNRYPKLADLLAPFQGGKVIHVEIGPNEVHVWILDPAGDIFAAIHYCPHLFGNGVDTALAMMYGTPAAVLRVWEAIPCASPEEERPFAYQLHAYIKTQLGAGIRTVGAPVTLPFGQGNVEDPAWFDTRYGSGACALLHEIVADLTEYTRGIVLLHGSPGGGKTTFIRCLAAMLSETHIAVIADRSFLDAAAGPDLIPVLVDAVDGGRKLLLIVEDAENLIDKGGRARGAAVSNVLNLTDGMLGDVLPIQFVFTFNADPGEIDEAIQRKNRLIASHAFGPLPAASVDALRAEAGLEPSGEPAMLAEAIGRAQVKRHKGKPKGGIGLR